jgi:putative spermidine/putrescine transport system ATP-binding protein
LLSELIAVDSEGTRMGQPANTARVSGARLELRDLTKAFGGVVAVDRVSLAVPAGAFVSLLGPSGSGKTTTLNLIAGFLSADAGDILFDGGSVARVSPHRRNIGMVFQSYSLFPHMTVADNVAFPLRMRTTLTHDQARARVAEMLALVRLSHLAARYPRQLSGGQQQRVAMARALVSYPRLLLMDEPLGALDKKLREQMQIEIKQIHRSVGTTVVYVTHDQSEALTMSDLVVVMHQSRIAQVGTPRSLYEEPVNLFVADFLGDSNLLPGKIVAVADGHARVETGDGQIIRAAAGKVDAVVGGRTVVLVRPEDLSVMTDAAPSRDSTSISGTVTDVSYHGDCYRLDIASGTDRLQVKVPRESGAGMAPGRAVTVWWRPDAARLLAADDAAGTPDRD